MYAHFVSAVHSIFSTADDEDELLYGDGETSGLESSINAGLLDDKRPR